MIRHPTIEQLRWSKGEETDEEPKSNSALKLPCNITRGITGLEKKVPLTLMGPKRKVPTYFSQKREIFFIPRKNFEILKRSKMRQIFLNFGPNRETY